MKYGDDKNNLMGFLEKFVEVVRLWKKLARIYAEIMEKMLDQKISAKKITS